MQQNKPDISNNISHPRHPHLQDNIMKIDERVSHGQLNSGATDHFLLEHKVWTVQHVLQVLTFERVDAEKCQSTDSI